MRNFIIRRLFQAFILLFFISALIYFILNLVPGGPFDLLKTSNPRVTQDHINRLNALLGLNQPWYERYFIWLGNLAQGNWSNSWTVSAGRPVAELIMNRLPYTVLLMGLSLIISIIVAVPIGVYSAVKQYSWADYLVTGLSFFGASMPTFFFGILMIVIFAVGLGWFPAAGGVAAPGLPGNIVDVLRRTFSLGATNPELAGREFEIFIDGLKHLVMPATVLSLFNLAGFSRFVRSSMLEVLKQDYMRTARAKGVAERVVILKHGLRNALIPVVTIIMLSIPGLFAGAIVTETIFSWPGMGRLFLDGIAQVDWSLVQGILVIEAFLVVSCNLLADIMYAVIDPRIQYG
ncbi:MAG: ABC transporter permease [Anaerolineae bacterium]